MSAQFTLSFGVPLASLSASAGGAGTNGTEYALPGNPASVLSWQSEFSSTPSAVNIVLQGSLDDVSYFTLDTTTVTAGEVRTVITAVKFVRARIVSKTGGGNTTVTLISKAQPTSSISFTGGIIVGDVDIVGNLDVTGTITGTISINANSLTGTVLAAGVVASSLTSLGVQAAPLLFVDNTYDIGASAATRPKRIYCAGLNVQNGGASGNLTALFGADDTGTPTALTNNTDKACRIGVPNYVNANIPVALITAFNNGTTNTINIGGGTSIMYAATKIVFITAADATTPTGTERWSIDASGHFSALMVGLNITATGTIRSNTGFNINGAAGASGTGTVISSITVTNGIVTAITVA